MGKPWDWMVAIDIGHDVGIEPSKGPLVFLSGQVFKFLG
jgi:hypothetical protein